MCGQGLFTQCETTQVRDEGMGAALVGYTRLYGQVPGGQAEYLRVPQAHFGPIKVPEGPDDGTVVVLGLGPIGDMACRIAMLRGHRVIGVDVVPERYTAIDVARRGGTISVSGVHGGMTDPLPLLTDDDPLGADGFATHRLPLSEASAAYEMFQKKHDAAVKIVFTP